MHSILSIAVIVASTSVAGLPPIGPAPNRADLAAAYLRVDAASMELFAEGIPGAVRAEANRRFDRATMQFFGGRPADVIRSLGELEAWIAGAVIPDDQRESWQAASAERQLLRSLQVRVEPAIAIRGEMVPTLSLVRLHDTPAPDAGAMRTLRIVVPGAWGSIELGAWSLPAADDATWTLDAAAVFDGSLGDGRWPLIASIVDGEMQPIAGPRRIGTVTIVPERPSTTRAALRERFDALGDDGAELRQARAAFRARLELLVDEPSATSSAQFLADPHALASALTAEIERLEAGANPYAEGHGDLWRVFEAGDPAAPVRIPARVIVPPNVKPGGILVIALHGAGGDENMFADGYGGGLIASLAEEIGAVVVSPATTAIALAPATLGSIIDVMVQERGIDRKGVAIIGHSMGAAAAMRAVDALPGTFCAWVAIGGAAALPKDRSAYGVILLGALDPLANPARLLPGLRPQADEAAVPIQVYEDAGHTLIVGEVLRDVMSWIDEVAAATRSPPAAPPWR